MEQFAETCRFILSCNYSSKIIEPIQSRCAVFRFRPLPDAEVQDQVALVAASEHLDIVDDAVEAITRIAQGDLRKALTTLQVAAAFCARSSSSSSCGHSFFAGSALCTCKRGCEGRVRGDRREG